MWSPVAPGRVARHGEQPRFADLSVTADLVNGQDRGLAFKDVGGDGVNLAPVLLGQPFNAYALRSLAECVDQYVDGPPLCRFPTLPPP